MINLSRNEPVAFVVPANTFLGSHLVSRLLAKKIQVVAASLTSSGDSSNLSEYSADPKLVYLPEGLSELGSTGADFAGFPLSRLDYAVYLLPESVQGQTDLHLRKYFELIARFRPKILLVSSLDFYEKSGQGLKSGEQQAQALAKELSLNFRIVRLAKVFGPKMVFDLSNPIHALLNQALNSDLHSDSLSFEYSSRDLYIDDAIDLLLKALFHGATSNKIYDGALEHPVKVSEIKQVLLDPLWHEKNHFTPTLLPPWPTPNLTSSFTELAWKSKTPIVQALKNTLHFFRDHPEFVVTKAQNAVQTDPDTAFPTSAKTFSHGLEDVGDEAKIRELDSKQNRDQFSSLIPKFGKVFLKAVGMALIFYALVYPALSLALDLLNSRSYTRQLSQALEQGDFKSANRQMLQLDAATSGIKQSKELFILANKVGVFKRLDTAFINSIEVSEDISEVYRHLLNGQQATSEIKGLLSGEKGIAEDDFAKEMSIMLQKASLEYKAADFSAASASIKFQQAKDSGYAPNILRPKLENISLELDSLNKQVVLAKTWANLLPGILVPEKDVSYLAVLQDNRAMTPGGGGVVALAALNIKHGRLGPVHAVKKDDLKQKYQDAFSGVEIFSSSEPDFPTNSRLWQWGYFKAGGTSTQGVVSLGVDLVGKIAPEAQISIEDGEYDKALETALNRLFFSSDSSQSKLWPTLNQGLTEKQLLIYLSDPKMFSFVKSQGWSGVFPRQTADSAGESREFLSIIESQSQPLSRVKDTIQESFDLVDSLDKDGKVNHKLLIKFNTSEQREEVKRRMQLYLPIGTVFISARLSDVDLKQHFSTFGEYGRTVFSGEITLLPKTDNKLVVEYVDLTPAKFVNGGLNFNFQYFKQPGSAVSDFNYTLNFPAEFKVVNSFGQVSHDQIKLLGDTSYDRVFNAKFAKLD